MLKVKLPIVLVCFLLMNWKAILAQQASDIISIKIDVQQKLGPLKPIWAFFGYDEPNYTYMKDGRKLLTELAQLSPVPVYVRVHSLLVTGDGKAALKWGSTNAYTEDAAGKPVDQPGESNLEDRSVVRSGYGFQSLIGAQVTFIYRLIRRKKDVFLLAIFEYTISYVGTLRNAIRYLIRDDGRFST